MRLARYENQELTEPELEAFAEELRLDSSKREAFVQHFQMTQELRSVGGIAEAEHAVNSRIQQFIPPPDEPKLEVFRPVGPRKRRRSPRPKPVVFDDKSNWLWKVAAVLIIGIVGSWAFIQHQSGGEINQTSPEIAKEGGKSELSPKHVISGPVTPVNEERLSNENDSTNGANGSDENKTSPTVDLVKHDQEQEVNPNSNSVMVPDPEVSTETLGFVWKTELRTDEWYPEREIRAGDYSIGKGEVEVRLLNGVRLSLVGPTEFSIENTEGIRLKSGKMSAEINPAVASFKVDTDSVKVVDLGTRFAVTANSKGDAAVHVYDGKVSAAVNTALEKAEILETGGTVKLDTRTDQLKPIAFDQDFFAPRPERLGIIEGNGAGSRVLDRAPRRISDETAGDVAFIIFQERSELKLARDLELDASGHELGEGAGSSITTPKELIIPAGTKVSTFLICGNDVPPSAQTYLADNFVRFDGPILGVVSKGEKLEETTRRGGSTRTRYPDNMKAKGIVIPKHHAQVSEDLHQISLRRGSFGKFIRVYVARD